MFNKNDFNKTISLLFLFLSLVFIGITIFFALTKPFVMYDDYYTLSIVRLSFIDMIKATAENVHPPLYYIILKVFTKLFNPTSNLSLLLLGKIVSIVPLVLLFVLIWTKIKNEFGYLVSGVFSLLICSSMQVLFFSTVIRMYSWALLFLTVQFVFAYDVLTKNTKKSWIIFTFAGICCAYTHYFTAISSIVIYLGGLIFFIFNNKSQIKTWLMSVALCVIAYLPWINILLSQFSAVRSDYWIKPITFNTVLEYFQFIFSPSNDLLGFILILVLITVVGLIVKNKEFNDFKIKYSLMLIATMFIVIAIGICLSLLIRPIFVSRYVLPLFGGLWLGFAILVDKFKSNEKIFAVLLIMIVGIAIAGVVGFINETNVEFDASNDNQNLLSSINNGTVVIFNDGLSFLRYSPYLGNDKIVVGDINSSLVNCSSNEIVVFDKHHDLDNSNFEKIGKINQDNVYLIKK